MLPSLKVGWNEQGSNEFLDDFATIKDFLEVCVPLNGL